MVCLLAPIEASILLVNLLGLSKDTAESGKYINKYAKCSAFANI